MSRRWILPAVLLVLLFTASLFQVEPGTVAVLRGIGGGRAFVLEPGLHMRLPFLQRISVFPDGLFKLDFTEEATSGEGSRVDLSVHFEGALLRERLLEFSERAAGRNAPTVIEEDVSLLIHHWVGERKASEISRDPTELADHFGGAARASGYQIRSLTVARSSGAPSPSTGPAPGHGTGAKIVLLGLDGADWQIIDPLVASGRLPVLSRLKKEGAWGEIRSMDPMLSPLLWTTVATGRPPEEHGVMDFLVRDPKTGARSPVSSSARKVKAIWNIFSESGLGADVVAWWATWPAEEIRGTLVSDRVAYSLFAGQGTLDLKGAVAPESYAATIDRLRVGEDRVTAEDLREFLEITPAELAALRERGRSDPPFAARNPVLHLARILAGTRTYQAIALDLLARGQPDLFAVYYQGIDEVSHRFAHYADPKMAMVTEEDHRRYRRTVESFYLYQDRLLGELLPRLDPNSLILVLSDHGFKNGANRPLGAPPDIEGQPVRWHRPYGIFLARGPMILPGEKTTTMSLLDVAPTLLVAAGLAAGADMPGAVRTDLFTAEFAATRPGERIATYEGGRGRPAPAHPGAEDDASAKASEAMAENLRSLGYIGGKTSGGESGTAFAHSNLAGILLQKGKLEEAEREAQAALRITPGYYPALIYLAEAYRQQRRFREALPPARQAAASTTPDWQASVFLLLANLYAPAGKPGDGIEELNRYAAVHGKESDFHSAVGILKQAGGDERGARAEYERALELDPLAQEPIRRLFEIESKRGNLDRLLPPLEKALQIRPDSPFHHNQLGLVLDQTGKLDRAEAEFRAVLKNDPDNVAALVNLGSLLARRRKVEEASGFLARAVSRDPRSLEARIGLGAALGIQGKTSEAIATLEEGRRMGLSSPSLYNALAMAYFQKPDRTKAIGALKESLKLDPNQSSARTLLAQWEKP